LAPQKTANSHRVSGLLFNSSWQKGAVENINKLIRQYIPKKSNFNEFSDLYIKNVAKKLNLRPRKKLGFSNPKTEFFKQIANFALAS